MYKKLPNILGPPCIYTHVTGISYTSAITEHRGLSEYFGNCFRTNSCARFDHVCVCVCVRACVSCV